MLEAVAIILAFVCGGVSGVFAGRSWEIREQFRAERRRAFRYDTD